MAQDNGSVKTTNGFSIPLPADLSPAERAQLKLYWHFAVIAVFNGTLAAVSIISQQKVISWHVVLVAFLSQGVLACIDAIKKYTAASGDVPLSTLFGLIRNEVASVAPAVQLSSNEQALQQSISDVFQPAPAQVQQAAQTTAATQSPVTQSTTQAAPSNVQSATTQVVPPTQPAIQPIQMLDTIPGIPTINPNASASA